MERVIQGKLKKAMAAQKDKEKSVELGREFVKAYVDYVHFIENIHKPVMATHAQQKKIIEKKEGEAHAH